MIGWAVPPDQQQPRRLSARRVLRFPPFLGLLGFRALRDPSLHVSRAPAAQASHTKVDGSVVGGDELLELAQRDREHSGDLVCSKERPQIGFLNGCVGLHGDAAKLSEVETRRAVLEIRFFEI